ncbi:MAG TPA: 2-hydroxyacid dehydrogenase [Acidocella sp.]|jgi:lactate dehydrogenase-like 2-hydroxyacid dehydrogenase|nr:2-hydroxyacid dehydrogenase [Acidocella sp.]
MSNRIKILSMGAMGQRIDEALDARYDVYRDEASDLETILAEHGNQIVGLVTRGKNRTTDALMARLPNLQIISNFGVGYDSIDVVAAAKRGIVVTNTPNVLNDEMADFTVGLMLATIRRFPQADRFVRSGQWEQQIFPLGASLRGRKVGIAGMGRIGKVIAKRLDGFDVPISVFMRRPPADLPYPCHSSLKSLAAAVDVLIVVLPGGAETKNIVNAEILEALGPNGILINVARGSVVDEEALIEALQTGKIFAAGLDVFAREPHVPEALKQMENVVLLPHIGTATHHTRGLMAQLVIDNVISWFEGKGPLTPVAETPVPAHA